MSEKKPRNQTRLINSNIRKEPLDSNFHPAKLPDEELDQLWRIAAKKNLNELCEIIEEEFMRRQTEIKA